MVESRANWKNQSRDILDWLFIGVAVVLLGIYLLQ
jgi:hypothetical protein